MYYMTNEINEWLLSVEDRFSLGTSTNYAKTLLGDEYLELVCSRDGKIFFNGVCQEFYYTAEECLEAMKRSFELYAEGKTGKLYWRITPEVCEISGDGPFRGYMRLFIAEK